METGGRAISREKALLFASLIFTSVVRSVCVISPIISLSFLDFVTSRSYTQRVEEKKVGESTGIQNVVHYD